MSDLDTVAVESSTIAASRRSSYHRGSMAYQLSRLRSKNPVIPGRYRGQEPEEDYSVNDAASGKVESLYLLNRFLSADFSASKTTVILHEHVSNARKSVSPPKHAAPKLFQTKSLQSRKRACGRKMPSYDRR